MKGKRYFNTSGPNIPERHYTLYRELLINKGIELVKEERYFTIWAPRQTVSCFKEYVKLRSFRYFREKDETTGKYKTIKEAALVYTFDTYINYFLKRIGAVSYLEPHADLGRSDLVIRHNNNEYVIEVKIYRDSFQYKKGLKQLSHYCQSLNAIKGIYLVFVQKGTKKVKAREGKTLHDGMEISTYIIEYDAEKDF